MVAIVVLLLILALFGGLGFAAHILWLVLIAAVILWLVGFLSEASSPGLGVEGGIAGNERRRTGEGGADRPRHRIGPAAPVKVAKPPRPPAASAT